MWSLYRAVARQSFRRSSRYRLATASGVFVNTVFGCLRASVLVSVALSNGGSINGLTGDELATFAFVSQGMIMIVGAFGDSELADRIKSGDIVVDLYRPADLQAWWLATWLGKAAFQFLARGFPPVLLGALAFDLVWPATVGRWVAFLAAALMASLVGFGLRFLASLSAFWLLDSRGVDQSLTLLISFFGGMLLPISLYPDWLESIARALPFAAMVQLPAEVYLGQFTGAGLALALATQLAWVTAILVAGRLTLVVATRRLVVQGG